jgi:hypothetical protein
VAISGLVDDLLNVGHLVEDVVERWEVSNVDSLDEWEELGEGCLWRLMTRWAVVERGSRAVAVHTSIQGHFRVGPERRRPP